MSFCITIFSFAILILFHLHFPFVYSVHSFPLLSSSCASCSLSHHLIFLSLHVCVIFTHNLFSPSGSVLVVVHFIFILFFHNHHFLLVFPPTVSAFFFFYWIFFPFLLLPALHFPFIFYISLITFFPLTLFTLISRKCYISSLLPSGLSVVFFFPFLLFTCIIIATNSVLSMPH